MRTGCNSVAYEIKFPSIIIARATLGPISVAIAEPASMVTSGVSKISIFVSREMSLPHSVPASVARKQPAGSPYSYLAVETFVPAGKQSSQMQLLLENLYRQQTTFGESDYSSLYVHLNKHVSKRSLLIIYTNFDRIIGMERQLSYMQQLARQHVVLVIFFEDVELRDFAARPPQSSEDCFHQVIADQFIYEKQYVTTTFRRHGIYSLLTTPENLSVDIINKYLEMKAKRLL